MMRTTTTKKTHEISLNSKDIISLLKLPSCASITFHVPGGGDYSNCDVDVSDESPIIIRWSEEGPT